MDGCAERTFLRRVYASFTGAATRERVRETVLKQHSDVTQPEPSPWHARHVAIARSHGLVQEHERERGRSLGIER